MKKAIAGIITLIILFVGVVGFFSCVTTVDPGYAAVQYSMKGGMKDEILTQGWHVVGPTIHTTNFTIGIEQSYLTAGREGDSPDDESFEVPTSDGKGLTVEAVYAYRYDVDKLPYIFTRFKGMSGKNINETFSKPNVKSWIKEVTARHTVTEILGEQRSAINIEVKDYLEEKFAPYGIIIENASLTNIDPDETTREAIQKKVTAQQEQELASIEAKTAKINADKEKEVALVKAQQEKEAEEINAEKIKINAEADAEAIRIRSEAEAEANKKLAESLTPELIESQKIEAWKSGGAQVPKIQGNSTPIVSMDIDDVTTVEN